MAEAAVSRIPLDIDDIEKADRRSGKTALCECTSEDLHPHGDISKLCSKFVDQDWLIVVDSGVLQLT